MDRIDYQTKIIEILDNALNELGTEEFDVFIQRIKEELENYN